MTVTLYSWTPPTTHTSKYLLRPTVLNGPRTTPLPRSDIIDDARRSLDAVLEEPIEYYPAVDVLRAARVLEDIDDWYSPQIEDDGFLERLDRSAEIVRFP